MILRHIHGNFIQPQSADSRFLHNKENPLLSLSLRLLHLDDDHSALLIFLIPWLLTHETPNLLYSYTAQRQVAFSLTFRYGRGL